MKQILAWMLSITLLLTCGMFAFAEDMQVAVDMPVVIDTSVVVDASVGVDAELEAEINELFAYGEAVQEKKVLNILIIGTDERNEYSDNARGDACLLLSLDKESGVLKIASFERAMGVPILDGAHKGQWDWLTHTFEYGGAELMVREIKENFNVDVHYYVRVNMRSLVELIDKINGIDIELTKSEAAYINTGFGRETAAELGMVGDLVKVSEGECHLNGATTLVYARCRKIDSDWKRIERHRKVLIAVLQEFMKMNPVERIAMGISALPYIKTNIGLEDFEKLIRYSVAVVDGRTEQMTVPVPNSYSSKLGMGGRSMFKPDYEYNSKILYEFIYGDVNDTVSYMAVGSKGDSVVKLQERLIAEGVLNDVADGIFGAKTEEAVKLMQKKLNMEETGVADAAFLEQLFPQQ